MRIREIIREGQECPLERIVKWAREQDFDRPDGINVEIPKELLSSNIQVMTYTPDGEMTSYYGPLKGPHNEIDITVDGRDDTYFAIRYSVDRGKIAHVIKVRDENELERVLPYRMERTAGDNIKYAFMAYSIERSTITAVNTIEKSLKGWFITDPRNGFVYTSHDILELGPEILKQNARLIDYAYDLGWIENKKQYLLMSENVVLGRVTDWKDIIIRSIGEDKYRRKYAALKTTVEELWDQV